MHEGSGAPGGRLVELSRDECLELLDEHTIGRLAWHGPKGPTVIPVNCAFDGHRIFLRTTAHSALARQCDEAFVAGRPRHDEAGHEAAGTSSKAGFVR